MATAISALCACCGQLSKQKLVGALSIHPPLCFAVAHVDSTRRADDEQNSQHSSTMASRDELRSDALSARVEHASQKRTTVTTRATGNATLQHMTGFSRAERASGRNSAKRNAANSCRQDDNRPWHRMLGSCLHTSMLLNGAGTRHVADRQLI